jgi:hypothetical protein
VPITTTIVSSNPAHGKVYSIQHYMIKFVSDLRQVGGFIRVLWFRHDITEMLLKVTLSTITPTLALLMGNRANTQIPFHGESELINKYTYVESEVFHISHDGHSSLIHTVYHHIINYLNSVHG